jgi:hypothetical protein
MDYMPFVAYIISVVSLALSAYTLYELNCTKNKTSQKPKASVKSVAKSNSTKKNTQSVWK